MGGLPDDVRIVWGHSRTRLLAANGPALAFVLAGLGVYSSSIALILAQFLALGVLVFFGARIGWRAQGHVGGAIVGAAVTGGLGALISLLKFAAH